jgi:general L-amino acid transport system permease protein
MSGVTSEFGPKSSQDRYSLFRDERFIQALVQVIFALILVGLVAFFYQNLVAAWKKTGATFGYSFLFNRGGFDTAHSFTQVNRESSNLQIIISGVLNTIFVALLGNVLSSVLGLIVGVARLSKNWLVNRIAFLYIEILRNIPLLLVIVASYYVMLFSLPRVADAIALPGSVFICNRGIYTPVPVSTPTTTLYLILIGVILLLSIGLAVYLFKKVFHDGFISSSIGVGMFLVGAAIAWLVMPQAPFQAEAPVLKGLNFTKGFWMSPELAALLLGLVLGTSPFIADIVRAGIQSVSPDQIEAAHALGLSNYQTFRLVVFPQAMRVMVPPMTSNYLSLTKNTSLASAIAYPELFGLSGTIINMTGKAVEMMALVMLIYLALSLLTALFMNWYNNKIKLVER